LPVDVELTGQRGEISVYVGVPDGEGPWPATLVISDALGMTANLRNQVDWLASVGYLAAAPDLIHRAVRTRCLFSTMRQALKGEGAVADDFETVRRWLASHEASTGRVAVAGFCFDGGFALLFAGRGPFDVAGSEYGGFTGGALASLAGSCPVVGRKAGHALKKDPVQIAEVLWSHSIPHDLEAFAESGHSFMNDSRDRESARWALIMGEMSTYEQHTHSAQDTRRRIRSFFDMNMAR
jgi:carboxymethylenebutenolidase